MIKRVETRSANAVCQQDRGLLQQRAVGLWTQMSSLLCLAM